jgi:hypothetical protein
MKVIYLGAGLLFAVCVFAHAQNGVPLSLDQQQQALQSERDEVSQRFDAQAKACWQRFMVNDCLQEARAQRRSALRPIEQREQALKAVRRAQAVKDRAERLEAKQPVEGAEREIP